MTKRIADSYRRLAGSEFLTSSPIRATDWKDMHAQQNYLLQISDEIIPGLVFDFSRPWETNSLANNNSSSSSGYSDIDKMWRPCVRLHKYMWNNDGEDILGIELRVFAENIYLNLTITYPDGTSDSQLVSATQLGWVRATIDLDSERLLSDTGRVLPFTIHIKHARKRLLSGTGAIYQVLPTVRKYSPSELPRRIVDRVYADVGTSYVFTPCGATGARGPTLSMVQTEYYGTMLEGMVSVRGYGFQEWVVPETGVYSVEAVGGRGGGSNGGLPAKWSGNIEMTKGEEYAFLVGQEGSVAAMRSDEGIPMAASGGGGSFILKKSGGLYELIVAAGGGGGYVEGDHAGNGDANFYGPGGGGGRIGSLRMTLGGVDSLGGKWDSGGEGHQALFGHGAGLNGGGYTYSWDLNAGGKAIMTSSSTLDGRGGEPKKGNILPNTEGYVFPENAAEGGFGGGGGAAASSPNTYGGTSYVGLGGGGGYSGGAGGGGTTSSGSFSYTEGFAGGGGCNMGHHVSGAFSLASEGETSFIRLTLIG